jgi:pimeloyl-ACP methyl ester carboxylesterase
MSRARSNQVTLSRAGVAALTSCVIFQGTWAVARTAAEIEVIARQYAYDIRINLEPPHTQDELLQNLQQLIDDFRNAADAEPSHSRARAEVESYSRLIQLIRAMNRDGLTLVEDVRDPGTGFGAIVLRDNNSGQTYIAFKGTDFWDIHDLIDDAGNIGTIQYGRWKEQVLDRWARDYPQSIVTGHSLGAVLGERYVADHPASVRQAVFFNAPGVDQNAAERFRNSTGGPGQPPRTPISYFQALHDLVSEFGGQEQLPGAVYVVTGGQVDPGTNGSLLMAEHRGQMLQSNSGTHITPIDFSTYQRNRQRNNFSWVLGQITDTFSNRAWVPAPIRSAYNMIFGNQRYAEPGRAENPFESEGWQRIAREVLPRTSEILPQVARFERDPSIVQSASGSSLNEGPSGSATAKLNPGTNSQNPQSGETSPFTLRRNWVIPRGPSWFNN